MSKLVFVEQGKPGPAFLPVCDACATEIHDDPRNGALRRFQGARRRRTVCAGCGRQRVCGRHVQIEHARRQRATKYTIAAGASVTGSNGK
jgi:hypothetical protein